MVRSCQKGLWSYKLDIKLYTLNGLGLGFEQKIVSKMPLLQIGVQWEVRPEVEPEE